MTSLEIRREERRLIDTRIAQVGDQLYQTFTDGERTVVQFGMLPANKTEVATKALQAELLSDGCCYDARDISRLLAVAVMDAANRGSQKMVV